MHAADWAVLAGYTGALVVSGWWFARRTQRDTNDYFLAARSMPTWAVVVSILATAQSAATFIGVPNQSFRGDLTYLSSNIGGLLAAVVLAGVFIPTYYKLGVTTPYQLLESRFGPGARLATSVAYLVGRVFSSGSRIFIGSIPAAWIFFGDDADLHVVLGVAVMTLAGILYTYSGGIRGVIWADVLQAGVYLGTAALAIAFLLHKLPAFPVVADALATLPDGSPSPKLTLLRTGFAGPPGPSTLLGIDFSREFTLLTSVTGLCLLTIASHGTDQDLVQRMLTCKSRRAGAWSVVSGILAGIPTVAIFLAIGLLLYVFYERPDVTGLAHARDPEKSAFLDFILHEVPPGLKGLMLAGLFAAGLSTVNSTLNSMSSTFVTDVYRHLAPARGEAHYLRVGKLAIAGIGLVLGVFAGVCVAVYDPRNDTLIGFALSAMSYAYAGLLGVFFTALFTRRGTSTSAVAALFAGFAFVLATNRSSLALVLREPPTIAFPWQLLGGTILATIVCALPRGRAPAQENAP